MEITQEHCIEHNRSSPVTHGVNEREANADTLDEYGFHVKGLKLFSIIICLYAHKNPYSYIPV